MQKIEKNIKLKGNPEGLLNNNRMIKHWKQEFNQTIKMKERDVKTCHVKAVNTTNSDKICLELTKGNNFRKMIVSFGELTNMNNFDQVISKLEKEKKCKKKLSQQ